MQMVMQQLRSLRLLRSKQTDRTRDRTVQVDVGTRLNLSSLSPTFVLHLLDLFSFFVRRPNSGRESVKRQSLYNTVFTPA